MAFSKILVLCLAVVHFLSMMNLSEARVLLRVYFTWEIPSPPDALDIWAQKHRYQIGDSIVFTYEGNKDDSVLEVNEADYKSCNRSNPIKSYKGGNTEINLEKSGPFFFISGAEGHCEKGEKVQIRVLAATHHHHHNSTAAPAPSPLPNDNKHHHGHAPAPAPAHHNAGASLRVGAVVFAVAALIVALV